jgi:hypothetical protein
MTSVETPNSCEVATVAVLKTLEANVTHSVHDPIDKVMHHFRH